MHVSDVRKYCFYGSKNMGNEQSVNKSRSVLPCDENMSVRLRNNCHPLHFHNVHGDNIRLSKDRTVACRSEGFCKGIVFSDRPIVIGEHIYVKFLETSPNWSGALRIGFTMNDPVSMKSKLPKYACPELTSMHGNWAKAVGEKLTRKDSILYYYVDQNGDVHYGIGAEEYGIFFGGVNTSGKLWAVLDIYGNTVAVEFVDPGSLNQQYQSDSQSSSISILPKEKNKQGLNIKPLLFHSVHGKYVTLRKNRSIVSRKTGFHSLAYAFTERPIEIGSTIFLDVLQTDNYYKGLFICGITSCDPKMIDQAELPENVDDLLDRPEYWVVKQNSYSFEIGDSIKFKINSEGQVELLINDLSISVFYVDHTQPLWFFVNLCYSVCELRLAGMLCNKYSEDELIDALDDLKVSDSEKPDVMPGPSGQQLTTECVICYEEPVNCALYRCGHMCMCYKCALKLFNSGVDAQCPICRNYINDVIRVYK